MNESSNLRRFVEETDAAEFELLRRALYDEPLANHNSDLAASALVIVELGKPEDTYVDTQLTWFDGVQIQQAQMAAHWERAMDGSWDLMWDSFPTGFTPLALLYGDLSFPFLSTEIRPNSVKPPPAKPPKTWGYEADDAQVLAAASDTHDESDWDTELPAGGQLAAASGASEESDWNADCPALGQLRLEYKSKIDLCLSLQAEVTLSWYDALDQRRTATHQLTLARSHVATFNTLNRWQATLSIDWLTDEKGLPSSVLVEARILKEEIAKLGLGSFQDLAEYKKVQGAVNEFLDSANFKTACFDGHELRCRDLDRDAIERECQDLAVFAEVKPVSGAEAEPEDDVPFDQDAATVNGEPVSREQAADQGNGQRPNPLDAPGQEAVTQLLHECEKYKQRLQAFCRRKGLDEHAAEDVVQSMFTTIVRNPSKLLEMHEKGPDDLRRKLFSNLEFKLRKILARPRRESLVDEDKLPLTEVALDVSEDLSDRSKDFDSEYSEAVSVKELFESLLPEFDKHVWRVLEEELRKRKQTEDAAELPWDQRKAGEPERESTDLKYLLLIDRHSWLYNPSAKELHTLVQQTLPKATSAEVEEARNRIISTHTTVLAVHRLLHSRRPNCGPLLSRLEFAIFCDKKFRGLAAPEIAKKHQIYEDNASKIIHRINAIAACAIAILQLYYAARRRNASHELDYLEAWLLGSDSEAPAAGRLDYVAKKFGCDPVALHRLFVLWGPWVHAMVITQKAVTAQKSLVAKWAILNGPVYKKTPTDPLTIADIVHIRSKWSKKTLVPMDYRTLQSIVVDLPVGSSEQPQQCR